MSDVSSLRPIETHYKGYRFRSRLEARWAVFFDAAGIEYQYEHEGFIIGGRRYLPDFWLPQLKTFVEIKPTEEAAEQVKPLLHALTASRGDRGILIVGPPNLFEPPHITGVDRHRWWNPAEWLQCPFCDCVSVAIPHAPRCTSCPPVGRVLIWPGMPSPRVDYAMEAGQQARFEYGEDPTPDHYSVDTPKTLRRVYVAGAVIEEQSIAVEAGTHIVPAVLPWRAEIFGGDGDFVAGKAAAGRFWYGGPTVVCNHGSGDHGLASRCLRDVADSNVLFAWIDRTDTVGTLIEIGAAHAWGKQRFIAFAGEELASRFYFVRQLANGAVVVPTAADAWRLFERWLNRLDA
jgi:hypothetical protein